MDSLGAGGLVGRHLLVVEDDYMVASSLASALDDIGVRVIGPVGSVIGALSLISSPQDLDGAILDINLGDEDVYPVADALIARGIPFVFASGYDALVVSATYAAVPLCQKPVRISVLSEMLLAILR